MKAIIFDLNGVVTLDEPYFKRAWTWYCNKAGFPFTDSIYKSFLGRSNREILETLHKRPLTDEEARSLRQTRLEYVQSILPNPIPHDPSLLPLLDVAKRRNLKLGIATSSQPDYCIPALDSIKIRHYFDVITTSVEVVKSKPDPEIYLLTAQKLNVDPKDCIVFEDAAHGVLAARSAGMYTIGITTTLTEEELPADLVISSFSDPRLAKVIDVHNV